jgi:hypothetical protein
MSMVICRGCDRLFDSDDDPDCFVEVGIRCTQIQCESCRESDAAIADAEYAGKQGHDVG